MSWLVNSGVWTTIFNVTLWQSTLSLAAPLALAAIGGVITERSGVVNIGLEGMMLTGAFFGYYIDIVYQNLHVTAPILGGLLAPGHAAAVGLLAAVLTGGIMAAIHAFAAIRLKADQIVSGMAINLIALGLTSYLFFAVYGTSNPPSPCVPPVPCQNGQFFTIPEWSVPGLSSIRGLGTILFQQNPLVYLMLILIVLAHIFLFRTTLGLRIRAVGEHPRAADTAGIKVQRLRYLAVILSGLLSGLAGGYLVLTASSGFSENMTSGQGFVALAAMIIGKWTPFGALGACLLFGFGYSLYSNLSTQSGPLQNYATLLQTLPYILTLIAVAGFIGRATPPAADGIPYDPAEAG